MGSCCEVRVAGFGFRGARRGVYWVDWVVLTNIRTYELTIFHAFSFCPLPSVL